MQGDIYNTDSELVSKPHNELLKKKIIKKKRSDNTIQQRFSRQINWVDISPNKESK